MYVLPAAWNRRLQETQSLPESHSRDPQLCARGRTERSIAERLLSEGQRRLVTTLEEKRLFFPGCQAQSPWCRRCGDASPQRLGLCGGINYSICLAAVRRSLETPWMCPSKHTKKKPPILSVNTPKHRCMSCHLDYATLFCLIEMISLNPAEVFLAQRRVLASEGRRSLYVLWRIRFSQCVNFSHRWNLRVCVCGIALTEFLLFCTVYGHFYQVSNGLILMADHFA